MSASEQLDLLGWCKFPFDNAVLDWVAAAMPEATRARQDPQLVSDWLRCGGTWFAGVNALPNDAAGALPGGPALGGEAVAFIEAHYGLQLWDRAQLSIIYPGYPREMEGESPAAFRFRRDRDAAHVDGLLPEGPQRRRYLREAHGFVLGLPLNGTSAQASPMVVWEGSHLLMRKAFSAALNGVDPAEWCQVDLTDVYQQTRRACFDNCARVVVHAAPGEAYVVHRLALHGVAAWNDAAPDAKRMIAYFRPELRDMAQWLR
jgi:hypothetical protein